MRFLCRALTFTACLLLSTVASGELVTVYWVDFNAGDDPGSVWSPDGPVTTLEILGGGAFPKETQVRFLGPFADDPVTNEYDAEVDLALNGIPQHEKLQAFFTVALFDVEQSGDQPDGNVSGDYTPGKEAQSLLGPSSPQEQITGRFEISRQDTLQTLIDGEQTPTFVYLMEVRLPAVGSDITFPLPPLGNSLFDLTRTAPGAGWQWGVLDARVQMQTATTPVPEPSGLLLLGIGTGGLCACGRRRRNDTLPEPASGEP